MPIPASQQLFEIHQIKEGIIILKNKTLRAILMVSSLNFALKSEDEQDAILYQFQQFLNSLDFFCQIVVQSRKLNITGYLEKLKNLEKNQKNELLKTQTASYREFITGLVQNQTIMAKTFFAVVPFAMGESQALTQQGLLKKTRIPSLTEGEFQRCKQQLWQRMEFVALGLRRCGLRAVPLNTVELIELFWGTHHPKEAEVGYYPEIPPELAQ